MEGVPERSRTELISRRAAAYLSWHRLRHRATQQ